MILINKHVFLAGTGMLVSIVKYACLFLGSKRLPEVGNLMRCLFPSIIPPIETYIDLPLISALLQQNLSLLIFSKKIINYHVVYYLALVDNDEVMAG